MLKSILRTGILAATLMLLSLPTEAQVWRSSTGNIFRFHSNNAVTVMHTNGTTSNGRWWWTYPNSNASFQLWGDHSLYNIYIHGYTASVEWGTGVTSQWTFVAHRGSKGSQERAADTGWFMAVPGTLRPTEEK